MLYLQVCKHTLFQTVPRLDRRIPRQGRIQFALNIMLVHIATSLPPRNSRQLLAQNLPRAKDARPHGRIIDS